MSSSARVTIEAPGRIAGDAAAAQVFSRGEAADRPKKASSRALRWREWRRVSARNPATCRPEGQRYINFDIAVPLPVSSRISVLTPEIWRLVEYLNLRHFTDHFNSSTSREARSAEELPL